MEKDHNLKLRLMLEKKIAIIGCGNLGLSILRGLLSIKGIKPSNITVTKRNTKTLDYLLNTGVNITNSNTKALRASEIIIVALKPYNISKVLKELSSDFETNKHILVSLATGISINDLEKNTTKSLSIFRAMPNTAAAVSSSLTCICSNTDDAKINNLVKDCFNSIGKTVMINESLMDSATVLSACGMAYVLRFIRAMVQGGIQIGFDSKIASIMVNQTVKGAAELLIERKEHPEYEIDKVTTPKGCTITGLNEMEHNGFSSALIKGIVASFDAIDK